MFTRITNEKGAVSYSKNIIEQVIRDAISPYRVNCWEGRYTGQATDLMLRFSVFDSPNSRELAWTEKGAHIVLYVVLRIGTPIRSTLEGIISSIGDAVSNTLELPIDNIIVNVTAVAGSKGISKREISLDYYGNYSNALDEE